MSAQSKILGVAAACIACLAGLAAALVYRHADSSSVPLDAGTYLVPRRALPEFSLIDQNGQRFDTARLHGHWSLMFFGYTNCPDFCPATLTLLAAVDKRLRAANAPVRPQVLFTSVDAKRDTPAQLLKYVPYFNPEFIGLTAADQDGIEAVAKHLNVFVRLGKNVDGTYTVDHSAEIFVIDPQGRLAAILTGPFSVDELQTDFERVAKSRA